MRSWLVVALAVVSCGGGESGGSSGAAAPVTPSRASRASSSSAPVSRLGPLAPRPPSPTLARVKARTCGASGAIELGDLGDTDQDAYVAVTFGATRGLAAWSTSRRLAVRPIDRAGRPIGPVHVADVPVPLEVGGRMRALDGYYLLLLAGYDHTRFPELVHYVVVLDPEGAMVGAPQPLAIGAREFVNGVSPGAAHGLLIYEEPQAATHVKDARLLTLLVTAGGAMQQSFRDFPDPLPEGAIASALFSFGAAHSVALVGDVMLVDGEPRKLRGDTPVDGFVLAPTFGGASVPVIGLSFPQGLGRAPVMRYGQIDLDGAQHFGPRVAPDVPVRPPFDDSTDVVSWAVRETRSGDDVEVVGSTELSDVQLPRVRFKFSGLVDNSIAIVWSGDQVLVLYASKGHAYIAPLPC